MATITLTKHHGLGNDFLIAVEPPAELGAADAIAWCERRRGIGADGLIVARGHGEDSSSWTMALWNADGSRAELSGNGLRCLAQALLLNHDEGGSSKRYRITTDAGVRDLEISPDRSSDTDQVAVDMGQVAEGPAPFDNWSGIGLAVEHQIGVDVGNPHLVANLARGGELDRIDLAAIGPMVEATYPDGINIEVIEVVDRSSINLRVWERGVGITEACGTGACAAAWAARRWDIVDATVSVAMPGGSATIGIVDDVATLTGPTTFVAVVEVEQT